MKTNEVIQNIEQNIEQDIEQDNEECKDLPQSDDMGGVADAGACPPRWRVSGMKSHRIPKAAAATKARNRNPARCHCSTSLALGDEFAFARP